MPAGKGKNKKKKRVSVPKKKGRKPFYIMPDWLHWLITGAIIVLISICAYYLFLRPYFYRWRPCKGTKEYGVCLPSGYLCYGIDVSHHQGKIDWDRVALSSAANGYPIRFVIMKATEGSTFTDPEFLDNIRAARAAGFVCGVYHFYNPGTSPEKQAEHYINTVKLQKGEGSLEESDWFRRKYIESVKQKREAKQSFIRRMMRKLLRRMNLID